MEKEQITEQKAMKEEDAAKYLGMSVSWLRQSRMVGNREVRKTAPPFCRLGRSIRYLRDDLDRWLEINRVDHNAACE